MFTSQSRIKLYILRVHQKEPAGIPHFIGKVAAYLNHIAAKMNILSERRDISHGKPERVGAEFRNQVERVGWIAERLTHFPALSVSYRTGKINVFERYLIHKMHSRDNHSGDPKENYIGIRRVVIFQILAVGENILGP